MHALRSSGLLLWCSLLAPAIAAGCSSAPDGAPPPAQDDPTTGTTDESLQAAQKDPFVRAIYRDVLGRQPSDAEVAAGTKQLGNGVTALSWVASVLTSVEHRQQLVAAYYHAYLNRAPEPAAVAAWTADRRMQDGRPEAMQASILGSNEYFAAKGKTPWGFVGALYQDTLGRKANILEIGYWTNQLGHQNREGVAAAVLQSDEYRAHLIDGWYQKYLHKGADVGAKLLGAGALKLGASDAVVQAGILVGSDYVKQLCIPKTCATAKSTCGSVSDGCGQLLDCGTCSGGTYCVDNACIASPPIYIENLTYAGTGCPAGSVASSMSADAQSFTLLFDNFVATAGPGVDPAQRDKSCTVDMDLEYPQGWTYAIATVDYRGFASLDAGVTARQESSYQFEGQASVPSPTSQDFVGPMSDDYTRRDTIDVSKLVFAPCGADHGVRVVTRSTVSNDQAPSGQGILTVDSADGAVSQICHVVWKKCP